MFHPTTTQISRGVRGAFAGLLVLSLAAGAVSVWLISEVRREQAIIGRLIRQLPEDITSSVTELPGELEWQLWLSILVALNGVASLVALVVLAVAYRSSERSLRDVKLLARDILASMDQSVITTDNEGVVTSLNPRTREMYGISNSCVGSPIDSLAQDGGFLADLCRAALSKHSSIHDRDLPYDRDGRKWHFRGDCCLLHDVRENVLGTVLYVRDVTERVHTDERLRRMERYMSLGSLAGGLQHEIKNPLGAVSLHVQLLEERLDELGSPEDVCEMLGVIKTEITRINGVLDSFRSFASTSELRIEMADVEQIVRKTVRLLGPQADLQQVTIHIEIPQQPLPLIEIDTMRFDQALLNLLVNGLEAMPDGGILTVRLSFDATTFRIDVGDTGCGIPDEVKSRILDPYFTTKDLGTGMGLALCEKIARQHGGQIDFQSSPEETWFTIVLPREGLSRPDSDNTSPAEIQRNMP